MRAYGITARRFEILGAILLAAMAVIVTRPAEARTLEVVAFGDSLSAGYELPADASFPAQLEQALRADGFDVAVANAGVSGDTASGGLERVDWSVPDGTDLAIVELGANDMLRGIDPAATRTALDGILARLKERGIQVLLCGMYAAPNLGPDYSGKFAAIFPSLAKTYGVPLYPFFLAGIIGKPDLHLGDGLHPNRAGVAVIVTSILPDVEAALRALKPRAEPLGLDPHGLQRLLHDGQHVARPPGLRHIADLRAKHVGPQSELARRDQDRDVRAGLRNDAGQFETVRLARQVDVGEDGGDLLPVLADIVDGLVAVREFDDFDAGVLEQLGGAQPDQRLVFDDDDDATRHGGLQLNLSGRINARPFEFDAALHPCPSYVAAVAKRP